MIYNEALTRLEDRYFSAVYDLEDAYNEHIRSLFSELKKTNKRRKRFPLEGDDMNIKFVDLSSLNPVYVSADFIREEVDGIYVESVFGYSRKFSELNVEEMSRVIRAINDCYFSNEENN